VHPTTRLQAVKPSPTLRITALAKELQAKGENLINLAAGEPDFDTPDPIKEAAITAIRQGFTKYTPTTGIPELRSAIADYLKVSRNLTYTPDQIAVTNGAKQAIFNILQVLVQEGDEVLIPSPYWVSYPEMVRLSGATPVFVPASSSEGFRLDGKTLERFITPKAKCLLLNSPSNPTGAILPERNLREIAEVANRHSLWVVSDEIYSELTFDGRHTSIASVSEEIAQRTLVVDGVSKSFAMTGWRVGYLAGSREVVDWTVRLQDHSTSNASSISQKAALAALTMDPAIKDHMVREFAKRRDLLVSRLSQVPAISFAKPEGAFYCFIDNSQTRMTAAAFAEGILKEEKVALIPGEAFGSEKHVRVSFCLGAAALEEGLRRFENFIRRLTS
jgi:aspartate aminotransferase